MLTAKKAPSLEYNCEVEAVVNDLKRYKAKLAEPKMGPHVIDRPLVTDANRHFFTFYISHEEECDIWFAFPHTHLYYMHEHLRPF